MATGKAGSTEHPSLTSWGVLLAPSQMLTPCHLLLRHLDRGMCPLKDRAVPSFSHPAAICTPSVPAGQHRLAHSPAMPKVPQDPRGAADPPPCTPIEVRA